MSGLNRKTVTFWGPPMEICGTARCNMFILAFHLVDWIHCWQIYNILELYTVSWTISMGGFLSEVRSSIFIYTASVPQQAGQLISIHGVKFLSLPATCSCLQGNNLETFSTEADSLAWNNYIFVPTSLLKSSGEIKSIHSIGELQLVLIKLFYTPSGRFWILFLHTDQYSYLHFCIYQSRTLWRMKSLFPLLFIYLFLFIWLLYHPSRKIYSG